MHIDVLPDVIGWGMVVYALGQIQTLAPSIPRLRMVTIVLTGWSVFDIVETQNLVRESGPFTWWVTPTFPLNLAAAVLDIMVIWSLCGLIMSVAHLAGDHATGAKAKARRIIYVAFAAFTTMLFVLSWVEPTVMPPLLIGGLVMSVLVFLLMVTLMMDAQRMCQNYRADEPAKTPRQSAAFGGG